MIRVAKARIFAFDWRTFMARTRSWFNNIEPAALVGFVATLFPIAVLLGWEIPQEAQDATLVMIPLVAGAITAALTRPIKVPAMVAGVEAVLIALIAWGVDIAPDLVPLLSAALLSFGGLLTSARVIPNSGVVDKEVVNA